VPAKRDLDPGASPLHFFGAEVRRAREAAGMTLADLGAAVPCDASTVSKIEAGILNPTERFLTACTEAGSFGIIRVPRIDRERGLDYRQVVPVLHVE
jgi:transcriptional regulator with XRE-family HTH domain